MTTKERAGPVGPTRAWVRDLALIGAASALAPAAVVGGLFPTFVAGAGVAGAASGALLGAVFPRLLLGPFSRLPIAVMLVVGALFGAGWGGAVGAAAGASEGLMGGGAVATSTTLVLLGGFYGALSGALQLGWFWLPYTLLRARGRAAWPIVALACVLSAGLGWGTLLFVDAIS